MTYSHFSRDFADLIRPVSSLCSKSEAAYSLISRGRHGRKRRPVVLHGWTIARP